MKRNIFESTSMACVHGAERIFDAVCEQDLDNGTFGYITELAEGESVIYKFVPGTKAGAQVLVANNAAWTEDTCRMTNQRRDKFVIEAGTPFRAYVVKKNDEFATAIEGVTTASQSKMQKDAFVTIDATTGKLVASATSTASAPFEGKVMRERMVGGTLATTAHNYGYATKMYEVKVETLA